MHTTSLRVPLVLTFLLVTVAAQLRRKVDDKVKCPKVKAIRNFNLEQVSHFEKKRQKAYLAFHSFYRDAFFRQ